MTGGATPTRVLPSGVVTFVFTDIEGSTRLLRRWRTQYVELLEAHRAIMRTAWQDHGGLEIATDGDAFFVAFEDARAAVGACVAAQRALSSYMWPDEGEVRVRIGVHAGLAWPRGDNYVALAVHQAARVVGAAHGGQVITTDEVAQRAGLPVEETGQAGTQQPDVALRPLGQFRVRDFDEPVQLFQVVAHGLAADFPPLRVLPADRHNLVVPQNELLGRASEMATLEGLVGPERLVTLVGTGGVGKSRLASEFGIRRAVDWEDGVWMIDLTGVVAGELIPKAVADAVGVKVDGAEQPWDAVLDHLRERRVLLIMDNCEHVRADAALRVSSLLSACPGLCVLATSREPLGLRDERIVRSQPLDLETSAIAMFAQRAGLGDVTELDAASQLVLRDLCREARRAPACDRACRWPMRRALPAEILSQLKSRRSLLRSQDPTLPQRQQSMDATIEWSHQLLTPSEQAAFRRLGIFVDGFDLDAGCHAVGDPAALRADERLDAAELIWSLASKSLLTKELARGATRYRFLESIRHAARGILDRSGETTAVAVPVGRRFLERFGPLSLKGEAEVIDDRAREAHNVRGLISTIGSEEPELAQTLGCAVVADTRQTSFTAAIDETRGFLVDLPHETPARVALLQQVAFLLDEMQRPEDADPVLAEAEALAQAVGIPPWLDGRIEQERGIVELLRDNPVRAREIAIEGLATVAGPRGRASVLELQMLAALELGEMAEALAAGSEALALVQERGDLEMTSLLLSSLAEIAWRAGDFQVAASRQLESLSLGLQAGRRRDIAFGYIMAARLAAADGQSETATRLQGSGDQLLEDAGASLYPTDAKLRDELLASCREELGPTQFDAEYQRGRALEAEVAVALASNALRSASEV